MQNLRVFRLPLYFLVGLMLGGSWSLANAETIAATSGVTIYNTSSTGSTTFASKTDACIAYCKTYTASSTVASCGSPPVGGYAGITCSPSGGYNFALGAVSGYACPVGQNWTLAGAICSRPDCVLPAVRIQATGLCGVPVPVCSGNQKLNADSTACICDVTTPTTVSYTVMASASSKQPPSCNNGCSMSSGGAWGSPIIACSYNLSGITNIATANSTCYARSGQTGAICSAAAGPPIQVTLAPVTATAGTAGTNSSGVADPVATAANNGDPQACGNSGGSYQVISGIGYCNSSSAAAPSSTQQIAVTSSTNPTTGVTTTSTATTTTTCTGVNACSNTTNTVVTVGAVTTSNNSSSGSGSAGSGAAAAGAGAAAGLAAGKGGDAIQFPTDYQRDATGISLNVKADKLLQVIGDPVGDDSAVRDAKATDAAKKELADSDKAVIDTIKGGEDGAILSSVSSWQSAMSSGWWVPVPSSSCSPFNSKIGPWSWNLDICPTAAKISEIGGYVMWVLLMFSGFLLLTTPQQYKWM